MEKKQNGVKLDYWKGKFIPTDFFLKLNDEPNHSDLPQPQFKNQTAILTAQTSALQKGMRLDENTESRTDKLEKLFIFGNSSPNSKTCVHKSVNYIYYSLLYIYTY